MSGTKHAIPKAGRSSTRPATGGSRTGVTFMSPPGDHCLVGGREAEPGPAVAAQTGGGPQATGPAARWELADPGGVPTPFAREQLVEALLNRSVSMNARVRPQGSGQWYVPEAFPELEPACASVSFARSGVWPKQASGMVVISSSVPRLLDLSKKLRHGNGARKPEFFLPILNKDPGVTMVTWTQLFAVWDRFYVGCVLESHYVKPGQPLNVFLIGMNCSDKERTHALAPSGFKPPDGARPLLGFTLSPFAWDVNHFPLGAPADAQQHTLGFRTISNRRQGRHGGRGRDSHAGHVRVRAGAQRVLGELQGPRAEVRAVNRLRRRIRS